MTNVVALYLMMKKLNTYTICSNCGTRHYYQNSCAYDNYVKWILYVVTVSLM